MYKFRPILKSLIWGGEKIAPYKGIETDMTAIGESWEISGVKGNESVVAGGADDGMTIPELIARDKETLLGKKNFNRFGMEFPLLIKFIDARQDLSIQVHPDDALAWERHQSKGKTEMWYVVDADNGARLRSGFAKQVTPDEYEQSIHSIGAGAFIAEIQQTSNITYRIYDFNRLDDKGNPRELHTELSKDAIDYTVLPDYRTYYEACNDERVPLVSCDYFTTSLLKLTKPYEMPLNDLDSFVILICTDGNGTVTDSKGNSIEIRQGESVLIPADVNGLKFDVNEKLELLTSWID